MVTIKEYQSSATGPFPLAFRRIRVFARPTIGQLPPSSELLKLARYFDTSAFAKELSAPAFRPDCAAAVIAFFISSALSRFFCCTVATF